MECLKGKAFAFINRELAARDLSSLDHDRHHIFCLLGQTVQVDEFELPGLPCPPKPSLRIVTCDKELYYEGRDRINLLIYDPNNNGHRVSLELCQNDTMISRYQVELGSYGEGSLLIERLPVGAYQICTNGEKLCSFTVAAYSLAPLVGSLIKLVKESDKLLRVSVDVTTYGRPLEGGIWVTQNSGNGPKRRVYAMVKDGVLEARLYLTGEGPYSLELQHAEDTELTATVPIPGTRRADRVETLLSPLSPRVSASLLPSSESTEIRELHLNSSANPDSPFRFERLDGERARITALQRAAPLVVAVMDPVSEREPEVYSLEQAGVGEVVEFDLPSPLSVVALGAYLGDQSWEGWALSVTPCRMSCRLHTPEPVQAGEEVTVEVDTDHNAAVYVLVKDARLGCRERPGDRMASRLLDYARDLRFGERTREVEPQVPDREYAYQAERLETFLRLLELDETQSAAARRQLRWMGGSAVCAVAGVLGLTTVELLERAYNVRLGDVGEIDPEVARWFPEHLSRRYRCVPIKSDHYNKLMVAMYDATDVIAIDDIQLITGYRVEPVVVDMETIENLLNLCYEVNELVEVEETVKDISAQDFGPLDFDDDPYEEIALDKLRETYTWNSEPENVEEEQPDREPAEVLFADWVNPFDGKVELRLQTPPEPGEISVEVFVVGHLDWQSARTRFVTEKQLIVSLDCPPFVHSGDEVRGRVKVVMGQPPFRLSLSRDGALLDLPEVLVGRKPLSFACLPGDYELTVEEIVTGRTETVRSKVERAGRISGMKKTVQWLRLGDRVCRELEPAISEIRVLDNLDQPISRLGQATADYTHLCCEQTAAKILAACGLWASAPSNQLEGVIRAGIEREKTMYLPGKGLAMYPGLKEPSAYWGPAAAAYLCQLELLLDCPMSIDFRTTIEDGISLGQRALAAHGGSWPPTSRETAQDCYLEMRFGEPDPGLIDIAEKGFASDEWGAVGERRNKCFQVAMLLRCGRSGQALKLLNELLPHFNENGRLYSTCDSVAALSMFGELRRAKLELSEPTLSFQGEELISVHATEGDVVVEVTRAFADEWSDLESTASVKAGLSKDLVETGRLVNLNVSIPDGYREGDLVWVSLPGTLAMLESGGQVRRFSVDFQGQSEVSVELVTLAPTAESGESVLLCLRNMFLEERVALPKPLRIVVEAPEIVEKSGIRVPAELCWADFALWKDRACLVEKVNAPELSRFLEELVSKALEAGAQSLVFEWLDDGMARCRYKTAGGMQEVLRYPALLQVLLAGWLRVSSGNELHGEGPQTGDVAIGEGCWPVSIIPAVLGPIATLALRPPRLDKLEWYRTLSDVQHSLESGNTPDLERLRRLAEKATAAAELVELLTRSPVPRDEALECLARLAGAVGSEV